MKGQPLPLLSILVVLSGAVPWAGDAAAPADTASPAMACGAPSRAAAAPEGTLISADTPNADHTRLFPVRSAFDLTVVTRAPSADTVSWSIADMLGKRVAGGSFPAPAGPVATTLSCTSTLAGYFAVSARLNGNGAQLAPAGTRPGGISTFGILPDLAGVIPAVRYAHREQHRFGMQGFNDRGPLLGALGISWTIDDRQLSATEPNGPNAFNPGANSLDPFYATGKIMRLIRLDGIPAWASPTGALQDDTHPPKDLAYYTDYMKRVGIESDAVRRAHFPQQAANYYQVTWEPKWSDSDNAFVRMYQAVYEGLHAGDAHAVVMGPADPFPSQTTERLRRLAPLGFDKYVDGIVTHGYYDAGTSPSHPPERLAMDGNPAVAANTLVNQMRALRREIAADYPRAGTRLFVTETGISYDIGSSYGPNYPTGNVLFAQGAVLARTHLILLGEGADQTYFFYGPDYADEVGYGTFFDLDHPHGQAGAGNLSPKPAAMAIAAMTRILDGTITLGAVNGTPPGIYAYAFQQLNDGAVITALWTHDNAKWSATAGFSPTYSVSFSLAVDSPGTRGTVDVVDMMGNASKLAYTNGTLTLNLTEAPVYVVSHNAAIAKARSTRPAGYAAN